MISQSCELCSAIIDSKKANRKIWNTTLYETQNFLIIPSIGPLVLGQVMIVSKDHDINLLSMSKEYIKEFLEIAKHFEVVIGGNALFAEHGSFNDQTGGKCIDHVHVHILPGFQDYFNILDDILPISSVSDAPDKVFDQHSIESPYILTFNSQNQVRLYEAYNSHSQMVRRAICAKVGRNDWNWRDNERIDLIQQTIKLWQQ
jgi:ATP adenylyltransferase